MAAADRRDASGQARVREGAACGAAAGGSLGGPGSRPAAGGAAAPRPLPHGAISGSDPPHTCRAHAERSDSLYFLKRFRVWVRGNLKFHDRTL